MVITEAGVDQRPRSRGRPKAVPRRLRRSGPVALAAGAVPVPPTSVPARTVRCAGWTNSPSLISPVLMLILTSGTKLSSIALNTFWCRSVASMSRPRRTSDLGRLVCRLSATTTCLANDTVAGPHNHLGVPPVSLTPKLRSPLRSCPERHHSVGFQLTPVRSTGESRPSAPTPCPVTPCPRWCSAQRAR